MLRSILIVLVILTPASGLLAQDASTLRLTVVDAENGAPLACRVYVAADDGTHYFVESDEPGGSAVRYDVARSAASYEKHTTVSAHPFSVELPPGRYVVSVERGKEYHPAHLTVDMRGDFRKRTIELRRWIDMAARGWYSGDTHVHRSLDELPNVMLAEDLNVALPLSYWVRDAYTPPSRGDQSTEAAAELIHVDDTHVIWPMNTEYELFTVNGVRHTLGAVFVLNHKRPLTPPAPPVAPVAAAAREQQALLDLDKHSWPWSMMLVPVMDVDLFELSNNHIWRTEFFFRQWTLDQLPAGWNIETSDEGFTEWGWIDFGFKTYYALLNCGFRMRPSAGTASGVHPVPLGYGRVYVHLPDGFRYDTWIDGLDDGRSFVTTGPMLFAEFDGRSPGAALTADGPLEMHVRGEFVHTQPQAVIELVHNGEIVRLRDVHSESRADGSYLVRFSHDAPVESSSWLAVRGFESAPGDPRVRFAHTAPVHIDVAGRPLRPRRSEVGFLIRRMETELERNRAVLSAEETAEYERALRIYRDIAGEARPEASSPVDPR